MRYFAFRLTSACSSVPVWFFLVTSGAYAADWDATASLTPSLTYTDNVCLDDDNKKSDWSGAAMLTPAGRISHQSRRLKLNVGGSVQVNTLTNSDLRDNGCTGGEFDDQDRFYPTINASAKGTVVPDKLLINASGRASQNEITSSRTTASDPLNRNTNTFYRYSIGPTWKHRYGNFANQTVSYKYDEVLNSSDFKNDSYRHAVNARLVNGGASQISWNVAGNWRRTSYSDRAVNIVDGGLVFRPRDDTELSNVRAGLGYQINRSWQVNGTYGWEFNDFQTARDVDTDGNAWDIGIRWTPSPRTTVSLGSGDRFFGSTPRINATHQYKRSTFNASYNKTITYERDITTQEDELIPGYENNNALYSNSPILDERFALGWSYAGRRARLNVNGSYSQQTRAEDGFKGDFKNLAVYYSPQISQRYTLTGILAWDQNDPRSRFGSSDFVADDSFTTWRMTLQVGRPLNSRVNIRGSYTFTDSQTDNSFGGYQENRFTVFLNIRL